MAPVFTPAEPQERKESGKLNKGGIAAPHDQPVVSIASRSFEQAFKNIDDVLRKEAGCTTELDDTEQTSWLLCLKYLDALEQGRTKPHLAAKDLFLSTMCTRHTLH